MFWKRNWRFDRRRKQKPVEESFLFFEHKSKTKLETEINVDLSFALKKRKYFLGGFTRTSSLKS